MKYVFSSLLLAAGILTTAYPGKANAASLKGHCQMYDQSGTLASDQMFNVRIPEESNGEETQWLPIVKDGLYRYHVLVYAVTPHQKPSAMGFSLVQDKDSPRDPDQSYADSSSNAVPDASASMWVSLGKGQFLGCFGILKM